jgi:hypothetical protein
MKKVKSPQEKKALSYAKDRRNDYGENDKASRRIIPLRKAKAHRSFRKKLSDILQKSLVVKDSESLEIIENEVKSIRKDNWKKYPDGPLGKYVERKLNDRQRHRGQGKTARKKAETIVEALMFEIKPEPPNRWKARAINLSGISVVGDTPEKAIEKLRYFVRAAAGNSLGLNITILIDGKLVRPTL